MEDLIRQVERAVFQDIHFDGLQEDDALQLAVEAVDLGHLGGQILGVVAVGHAHPFRVVGDGQVFIAPRLGGLGHLLQGVAAVGGLGVGVEVAPDVRQGDELREPALLGRGDFAPILPQLRLDEGQVHHGEDLRFGAAGEARLPPEDPVFVDLEAPLHPQVADGDVVGLGAGEVMQGGAVALLGHHPQVHLQAVAQHHGGFGVAPGQHLAHVFVGHEGVHHPPGLLAGDQDVQVAHGLLAAAVAAGHDGLGHPRHLS